MSLWLPREGHQSTGPKAVLPWTGDGQETCEERAGDGGCTAGPKPEDDRRSPAEEGVRPRADGG